MEKKDFRVSCVADDKEIALNLPIEEFEEKLNAQFKLMDYGEEVIEFLVVFIILPSTNISHESRYELNQSTKEIELGVRLPHAIIIMSSSHEAFFIMRQELLKVLNWCEQAKAANMNWSSFIEDIEQML